jgi:hypothetical protein
MAQYTKCATYGDYKKHGGWQNPLSVFVNGFLEGLKKAVLVGGILGLLGTIGGPLGVLIMALIGGFYGFTYGFINGFCEQWLNWRLVCISKDRCAIGRVAWIEWPGGKFEEDPIEWMFDNDLSFNLRMVPYNGKVPSPGGGYAPEFPKDGGPDYPLTQIITDNFPPAALLTEPSGWDLSWKGYEGSDKPDHPGGRWTLHCEIEGNGMKSLCDIARVLAVLAPIWAAAGALAGAVIGAVYGAVKAYNAVHKGCKKACKIPILCDIVCFILAAAAAVVAAYVGAIVGAFLGALPGLAPLLLGALISLFTRHNGDFGDVANDPDSGNIEDNDCVAVWGDHVYDAGHLEGWAEIHPVKHLQKVCSHDRFLEVDEYATDCCPSAVTSSDPNSFFQSQQLRQDVQAFWDKWCTAIAEGKKPEIISTQSQPQNWWCLHPVIDGCRPSDVR